MKNPHLLSAPHIIDPSYSSSRRVPDAAGLSLFSTRAKGPRWLYGPGDLEAFLLARLRHEAFLACCHVGHPGRFRPFSHILFARATFTLRSVPRSAIAELFCSGHIDLRVNGQLLLHTELTPRPNRHAFDLRACLKRGENQILVRLHRIDEPPTLLLKSAFLETNDLWRVSRDDVTWSIPTHLPFEGSRAFPHQERLPERRLRPHAKSGAVYDFGVELLGRPEATRSPGKGALRFHPGETLAEAADPRAENREQLLLPPRNVGGVFTTRTELALRHLRVQTPSGIAVRNVALRASFFPVRYDGAFACSDPLLNRIWMHAAYTLRLCMRELFVDGLKRDRLGWVGDLYLSMLGNAYAFGEREIERRSLTALFGENPQIIEFNGIIDYTLLWIVALWTHVLHHGDDPALASLREQALSLMPLLEDKEDETGFLPSKRFSWIFIDWAPLDKDGYSASLQLLYAMALEAVQHLAATGGRPDLAARFRRRAERLRRLCRERFWDSRMKLFADAWPLKHDGNRFSRHAHFLAFLSGAISGRAYGDMLRRMTDDGRVVPVATPYMMALECAALGRSGRTDRMLQVLRGYWGGMLERGACTFWEAYDPKAGEREQRAFYHRPYGKSLCHAWSSGPVFLLSGELLGVRPLAPGWRRFTVGPNLAGLDWACATVPTPQGAIQIEAGAGRLSVRVPAGASLERKTAEGKMRCHIGPCTARWADGQGF